MAKLVYLERDGDQWRVWVLTDTPVSWGDDAVLTRSNSHLAPDENVELAEGDPCDGYYTGDVAIDDSGVLCILTKRLEARGVKPKKWKIKGKPLNLPTDGTFEQSVHDQAQGVCFDMVTGEGFDRLCWPGEGMDSWLSRARERSRDKQEAKRREEARRKERKLQADLQAMHDGGNAFINPYTFVPLPATVRRDHPRGHAVAAPEGLTGWLDVEYAFQTPLMLPCDWRPPTKEGESITERITVPGSSVRGSTRSIFEVLSSSCLSVTDTDYVPVHRQPLEHRPNDRLAVVTSASPDGVAEEVALTSRVVWVRAEALRKALDPIRSGQRVDLDENKIKERTFTKGVTRFELAADSHPTPAADGAWVIHVADAGTKGKYPFSHVYCAVGELGGTTAPVPDEVWEDYRDACRHSADVAGGQLADKPVTERWAKVQHKHSRTPSEVGERRRSDGTLCEGDTVWVELEGGRVSALKLASSWRAKGKHPVSERLPDESLLPCEDPSQLCLACATFGFIKQKAKDAKDSTDAEHNAYASHVRFSDFESDDEVTLTAVLPPPLRSPRASAGAFYLMHSGKSEEPDFGHPQSRWGSRLDKGEPRQIAGRKYYWHGQEQEQKGGPTPRHVRRSHYPRVGDLRCKDSLRWVTEGCPTLRGRVYFENIDATQLGLLIAALAPQALADHHVGHPDGVLATHLGGGKPLGFGTATGTIVDSRIEDAAGRYRTDCAAVDVDPVAEAVKTLDPAAPPIRGLLRVLDTRGAHAVDRIWYPTMKSFIGRDSHEVEFDQSYRFYAQFSGGYSKDQRIRTLPPLDEPIQYMSNRKEDG